MWHCAADATTGLCTDQCTDQAHVVYSSEHPLALASALPAKQQLYTRTCACAFFFLPRRELRVCVGGGASVWPSVSLTDRGQVALPVA
jgi:hypothetical protein